MTCQVVCKLRLTIFWTVKDSCLNKYTVYVLFCSLQTFAAVDSGQYLVVAVEFSWRFSAAAVVFVGHYIAARVASRIVWITTSCTDNIVRRGVAHCSSSHVHCWHARRYREFWGACSAAVSFLMEYRKIVSAYCRVCTCWHIFRWTAS